MGRHRLTDKKRRFFDAYLASCTTKGDLSTGSVVDAAKVAGYSHPQHCFRMMDGSGNIKDPSLQRYWDEMNQTQPVEPAVNLPDSEQPTDDASVTLAQLREVRDDPLSPPGAKVRAAELLLKHHGIDRPTGDEDEADPEEALRHMAILLGVDGDVDPFTYESR